MSCLLVVGGVLIFFLRIPLGPAVMIIRATSRSGNMHPFQNEKKKKHFKIILDYFIYGYMMRYMDEATMTIDYK